MPADETQVDLLDENPNIRLLIHKRGQLKAKLTRFKGFLEAPGETNITQLKLRLGKLEECWSEFERIQSEIELLDTSEAQLAEREYFEEHYFALSGQAHEVIETSTISQKVNQLNAIPTNHTIPVTGMPVTPQVRLPSINIPTFSGNYDDWIEFSDAFTSLIRTNDTLSDIQKLHYLKSALRGDAAQAIHSLETSQANYAVAWGLLEKRYKNLRVIVQKHVRALHELPSVERETAANLRHLLDGVLMHMRALAALDQPTDQWDTLIVHLVTSKLNSNTYRDWEMSLARPDELPSLTELTDFLQRRCHILETSFNAKQAFKHNSGTNDQIKQSKRTCLISEDRGCHYCGGNHIIYHCTTLLNASTSERSQRLKGIGLCFNCLKRGHIATQCKSGGCKKCNGKHHTILHGSTIKSEVADSVRSRESVTDRPQARENSGTQVHSAQTCSSALNEEGHVLLSTALVNVVNATGISVKCRALLDSGSQSCFMSERMVQHLSLPKTKNSTQVTGIGQCPLNISGVTHASIRSCVTNFKTDLNFLVVPKITNNLPGMDIDASIINVPKNIILADPTFGRTGKIDVLLGQEVFLDLLCIGQIKSAHKPTLQKTKLGWIVGGKLSRMNSVLSQLNCHLSTNESIDRQLKQFWSLEDLKGESRLTLKEKFCEDHYEANTTREASGRYVVKMALSSNTADLGESREIALKRFAQVERRLQRDPLLRAEYVKFMDEYLRLHHMSRVERDSMSSSNVEYYVPHHPVINPGSTTTKVRVVFDASAKTSSGVSLNDLQLVGPTVQRDLFSIILSFRMHSYVMTADVEKMYRQILIDESQRDLLKIVWRSDPSQPIQTYKLNTITYGTSSAPYLATRTLNQLAEDEHVKFPIASAIVKRDFYVDDLLTGASTETEAVVIQKELCDLLSTGGFNLRKWTSNSEKVLSQIPSHQLEQKPELCFSDADRSIKTLGLWWDAKHDEFRFKYLQIDRQTNQVAKRTMLSDIARLFDPLGMVSPVLIRAKILLQDLWKLKLTWDESLPMNIHCDWKNFLKCLRDLNEIRIPRQATLRTLNKQYELHGFSDSSEHAYGAAVYIRHEDTSGIVQVRLLCSKSRVCPIQSTSLPRLELCAALLLAELMNQVEKALDVPFEVINYWTDSTITLAWINAEPSRWTTFVANRVAKIQELTKDRLWNHIRSEENPADLVSRGTTTKKLMKSTLWWNGPLWLSESREKWPTISAKLEEADVIEERPEKRLVFMNTEENSNDCNRVSFESLIKKYSCYEKLIRVIAWMLRFIHNSKSHHERNAGMALHVDEIKLAERIVLQSVQEKHFPSELKQLNSNSKCSSVKIASLDPFLGSDGLIRVGGRLAKSSLNFDTKHQILLPKRHPLTDMIAVREHKRQLHCGPQALLYSLRQKYWPINGHDLVRRITRKCIQCFKSKPTPNEQKMGNLPANRINPARPFLHTGVDFCGPFQTKLSKRRNSSCVKSYVAVFVCLATKAIHLELISDLTTDAFLAAMRRFISRRGICQTIRSDNGKTFVGACNKLNDFYKFIETEESRIKEKSSRIGITWYFNTPYAPHQGGLWEAAVKSLKTHLVRIVGTSSLTFEELNTVLIQVEGVLNSRPLTPLSSNPSDFSALTPSHFLIGSVMTTPPENNLTDIPENRLSRWQRLQRLTQHFWRRWSHEYLCNLQQRNKWKSETAPLKIGQLVVAKEDNLRPLNWPLCRVIDIHPDEDGHVRNVTIRLANRRECRRNVNVLCPLPEY